MLAVFLPFIATIPWIIRCNWIYNTTSKVSFPSSFIHDLILLTRFSQTPIHNTLIATVVFSLIVYSSLAHKEFRFIFPLMPILLIYVAFGFRFLLSSPFSSKIFSNKSKTYVIIGLAEINFALIAYFALFHQRGTIDAMDYLRHNPQDVRSVWIVVPCHQTPLYSHFHFPQTSMRFLDCSPPLQFASSSFLSFDLPSKKKKKKEVEG